MDEKKALSNFTPVLDSVAKEAGITAAIVFGAVWRYCQMEDGVCWASQQKIADRAGVSRSSVKRHIKILIEKGYLREISNTPGQTIKYLDTNKAHIEIKIGHGDMTQTNEIQGVDQKDPGGRPERSRGVDQKGLQRKNKETNKKEEDKTLVSLKTALLVWKQYFPNKPQPRPKTKSIQDKWRTRIKDSHFVENYEEALQMASMNTALVKISWFNFRWFVRSEEQYQKLLDDDFAWMAEKVPPPSSPDTPILDIYNGDP